MHSLTSILDGDQWSTLTLSLLFRLYVEKLAMFHFAAVKMIYRTVLELTSIFSVPFAFVYIILACTNYTL
jgi:hypothetical protein